MLRRWNLPPGDVRRPLPDPELMAINSSDKVRKFSLLSVVVSDTASVTAPGEESKEESAAGSKVLSEPSLISYACACIKRACKSLQFDGERSREVGTDWHSLLLLLTRPRLDRWGWVNVGTPMWSETADRQCHELWGCQDERDEAIVAIGRLQSMHPGADALPQGDDETPIPPCDPFGPFSRSEMPSDEFCVHRGQLELKSATVIHLVPPNDAPVGDEQEYDLVASACVFDDSRETSASSARRLTIGRGPALVRASGDGDE